MIAVATYKHGDWLSGQTLSGQVITGQFCGYSMSGMPRLDIGNGADRALMVINDSVAPATPPIAEPALPSAVFSVGDRAKITELGGRSQKWLNQIVEILAVERDGKRLKIRAIDPETHKPYVFFWSPDRLEKVGELAETDSPIAALTSRINSLSGDLEQALEVEKNAASSALLLAKELGNELLSLKAQVKSSGGKWEDYRNAYLKISSSRATLCQRIATRWSELEQAGVKSLNQADITLRPPKQLEANPQTSAEIDTEEVERRAELIGDLVPPTWSELRSLYSQIGKVSDWKGGIAVESERWAFTVVFKSREEAWQKWEGKYRALLDRQTAGQKPPESAPVEELESDTAIDNPLTEQARDIVSQASLEASDNLSRPSQNTDEPVVVAHPAGIIGGSKSHDRYTPAFIWEAGLNCFGVTEFDLDPASHAESPIPCRRIFTKQDNGLAQEWVADTLWSNFPYSDRVDGKLQAVMHKWVAKLIAEYEAGNVKRALTLVKSDCRPEWFHQLLETCTAYCFIRGAVRFECPEIEDNRGSFFGSVVFYLGDEVDRFYHSFAGIGAIGQVLLPEMFGE